MKEISIQDYQAATETLAMSLLRLPMLEVIHQPNNKLFITSLAEFRNALNTLWEENETVSIRTHRARMYINQKRLAPNKDLVTMVNRLMEFFESRNFYGFQFVKTDPLTDGDIVEFIRNVNKSGREKEPSVWLAEKLKDNWVTPIVDSEFNITITMTDDGTGKVKPVIWNSGVRTLAIKAKQSYSRALAVITSLNDKLTEGEPVNINKPRRVVQDMVEGLFQNENLLLSLSTIRDYDDYTCTHSVNVAILSMCLGKRIGLSKIQIMTLGLSALFHDLGKVDIPVELIRKTSKFTPEEYETVKNHPMYSVIRILRINAEHTLKSKLLISPYEHHLGIDLKGYPSSIRSTPLTLAGRIVAIADHYDALTSSRSYRPIPISPEQALDIMLQVAGAQLDELLLKVFINMIGIYPVGTLLLLDSHKIVIVAETPPGAEQGRPLGFIMEYVDETLKKGPLIDLSEQDEFGGFIHRIVRCFHPTEFGLNPSDYLL
jgi:HD-GYP domain-containing protein (c-di-GMP phosphodiesterase class II)